MMLRQQMDARIQNKMNNLNVMGNINGQGGQYGAPRSLGNPNPVSNLRNFGSLNAFSKSPFQPNSISPNKERVREKKGENNYGGIGRMVFVDDDVAPAKK